MAEYGVGECLISHYFVYNFNLMKKYKKVVEWDSNLLCIFMRFKFDLSYINFRKES